MIVVLTMIVAGAQGVPFGLEPAGLAGLALPAIDLLPPVVADMQELAATLATAPTHEAVLRVAAAAGYDVAPVRAIELPLATGLALIAARDGQVLDGETRADIEARVAALPVGLEPELARLVGAALTAHMLRAEALSALSAGEIEFLAEAAPRLALAGEHGWAVESIDGAAHPMPMTDAVPDLSARVEELAALVDPAPFAAAAAVLVEAATDAIPALRAIAATMPPPTVPASHGCDVFEEAPYICVRGTGNDDWHDDWWISVDLGGNDVWTNNQGSTVGTGIPVALLVDVDGNDAYIGQLSGNNILSQGAASLGVGVLVDGGGTNRYSAVASFAPPPLTPNPPEPTVMAQGAATLGAGVLVDLGGDAVFTATAATLGGAAAVTAQGAARLGGVGVLVSGALAPQTSYDALSRSDFLLVIEEPTLRVYNAGPASTVAQGGAEGGAGALIDLGGDDAYGARAHGSTAATIAQGAAELGAGILVAVGGQDTREAAAVVDAVLDSEFVVTCPPGFICSATNTVTVTMGAARTHAQGAASAGAGLLAHIAGAGATNTAVSESVPLGRSGVSFGGGGGTAGAFHAVATVTGGHAEVFAHGAGATGAGVLLALGDAPDAYTMTARSEARAIAQSTGGSTNTAQASATGGDARPRGQGQGNLGAGVLLDVGGTDIYGVVLSATATAIQNGLPGTMNPGAVSFAGRAFADGAAAVGLLIDLGGRDAYSAVPDMAFAGADDTCWTNSPPSLPDDIDTRIAMGIDSAPPFGSLLGAPCFPVPPN